MQDKINQRDTEGKEHGPWIQHYSDGALFFKGEYVHGKLNGPWISYYTDNELAYKGTFKYGKAIGYHRALTFRRFYAA
jgi:antitoxin component YwqK of YwqJK toxin-antitoxin module